eukprot:3968221-Amphidinium_carterae.2
MLAVLLMAMVPLVVNHVGCGGLCLELLPNGLQLQFNEREVTRDERLLRTIEEHVQRLCSRRMGVPNDPGRADIQI